MVENNGHEERDVNVRAVTKAGLGIGAMIVVAVFLMWFLFDLFARNATRRSPQPEPMASSNPQKEPPEPRLETTPVLTLRAFRDAEEVILNNYGWVDPEKGIVRIPVERALELVSKDGLPTRRQGAAQ